MVGSQWLRSQVQHSYVATLHKLHSDITYCNIVLYSYMEVSHISTNSFSSCFHAHVQRSKGTSRPSPRMACAVKHRHVLHRKAAKNIIVSLIVRMMILGNIGNQVLNAPQLIVNNLQQLEVLHSCHGRIQQT